jgi:hypothetical protein
MPRDSDKNRFETPDIDPLIVAAAREIGAESAADIPPADFAAHPGIPESDVLRRWDALREPLPELLIGEAQP